MRPKAVVESVRESFVQHWAPLVVLDAVCFLVSLLDASTPIEPPGVSQPSAPHRSSRAAPRCPPPSATRLLQCSHGHGSTAQVDTSMLAATALSIALALAPPTAPPSLKALPTAPPSLKPCKGESDCISSNGLEAPNHFQAPLAFAPKTRDKAFADAVGLLRDDAACTVVDDASRYIQARCGGDNVELLLRDDVVTCRVAAVTKGITPPWCIEKNCINGSMGQRKRILKLGERLGWSPIDSTNLQDEGRWTPIFFNTDAVPRDE